MYILGFDLESAGSRPENGIIGIGLCVLTMRDSSIVEVDRLLLPGYFGRDKTNFEKSCWDQFWSKNEGQLDVLKYNGPLSVPARQKEMIQSFQDFRKKWETKAAEENVQLVLVSDNPVFDGGYINLMIYEHLPDNQPIPYSAATQEYSDFVDLHNTQRGLLMGVDREFDLKKWWGFSDRIYELYDAPLPKINHDHNPVNDAHTIAHDLFVLLEIQQGKIERKRQE